MDEKTRLSGIILTINLHGSRQFRITLKLRSTKPEFDKAISATSKNLSEEAYSVRKDLNKYLLKAEIILSRLDNPSKEVFTCDYRYRPPVPHYKILINGEQVAVLIQICSNKRDSVKCELCNLFLKLCNKYSMKHTDLCTKN